MWRAIRSVILAGCVLVGLSGVAPGSAQAGSCAALTGSWVLTFAGTDGDGQPRAELALIQFVPTGLSGISFVTGARLAVGIGGPVAVDLPAGGLAITLPSCWVSVTVKFNLLGGSEDTLALSGYWRDDVILVASPLDPRWRVAGILAPQ